MEIAKPSEDDKEFFRSLVPDEPGIEVRPMFGNLAARVNGNMFMGLFGPDVGLRLPDDAREELLEMDGAGPFGPEGRPMKEYASIPQAWREEPGLATPWIERALDHAAAMPTKS
jgi:TfoX/Sxy family transcriptional regulator of competence genes